LQPRRGFALSVRGFSPAGWLPPELTQHLMPVVWKEHWTPLKPFLLD